MLLLRLPPEILRLIFDQIGSLFFHEDLGRLTVCKQWFEFALPTSLKCITLSRTTLQSLITSGIIQRSSLFQDHLETLDIGLRGIHPDAPEYVHEPDALDHEGFSAASLAAPKNLEQLATITRNSHRLCTLRIRVGGFLHLREYLPLPTMQALLLVENLRVLVLDLPSGFMNWSGQGGNGDHICPAIGALLCTLRTLRLRMSCICPDVLKSQGPSGSLQLSEVVINLRLTEHLPSFTTEGEPDRCGSQGGGFPQLKADLCAQAEALATQMAFPKVMRILTRLTPQFETESLDILTGKTVVLDDAIAWDEDIKTVEEASDTESEIILDDESSDSLDE